MSENKQVKRHKYTLLMDSTRCIGCFACEVACKMEHGLPAEPHPIRGIMVGPTESDGELVLDYHPVTCAHCDRPSCVLACPTGAMRKREDGIVFSDLDLCIGCQTCAVACPFGIPQLNPATGKIAKCDGCKDRIDMGMWPACALKCPTGALLFTTPERAVREIRQKEALRFACTVLSAETVLPS
jgi:Fe-S-cluster-containing dehydrogenase component